MMNSINNLYKLVACVCIFFASNSAFSERNLMKDYYLGIQGGTHFLDNWSADVKLNETVNLRGKVDFSDRFQVGGFVGRQTKNARFEVEYQHGFYDIANITLGRIHSDSNGDGNYQVATFNAYRKVNFFKDFSAFLGGGVGWGRSTVSHANFNPHCDCFGSAQKDGFAYQGRVGLEYQFHKNHHFFAQYTFLHLDGPTGAGKNQIEYDNKWVSIFGAGYRYSF
ncbi:hypothetical protein W03_23920 [Nitrosomonas sp. PY1]|uniref:outer membrane protein n=1 Tax=Nitrosomonas sp. PY1 TaxID=1803906 RepID=UPI001FC8AE16|nr:outer membrane beta-barrel protein [Nitrosomonas sp. PY1]GKS70388.1 hypothetical protein W03_23920 [Nitrosomonas sp. PY1]